MFNVRHGSAYLYWDSFDSFIEAAVVVESSRKRQADSIQVDSERPSKATKRKLPAIRTMTLIMNLGSSSFL